MAASGAFRADGGATRRGEMRVKFGLWPLLLLFLFSSCQSINRTAAEVGLPGNVVIFSFDDGPDALATARLLDVLKRHEIRALFCLLGENAERYPELVRRIHAEGHYIVNHGHSDRFAVRMGAEEFRIELGLARGAISSALGFEPHPRLYRPHGGFYRARHERIWLEEGYVLVPATIRLQDAVAAARSRDRIVRRTIREVERRGGGIILLHDGRGTHYGRERGLRRNPQGAFNRAWVPDAVEEIIVALIDRGFVLNGFDVLGAIGIGSPPGPQAEGFLPD